MKDFVAGATNGTDYTNAAINYHLDDTVANIANVAGSILQNSGKGYDLTDSVANIKVTNITIDASAQTKDVTIKLSDIKSGDHITLSATGGTGNYFLQGDDTANTLVGMTTILRLRLPCFPPLR